jgi:NAD(P)-dependent dehydrogenase (short-subunit alcohol dehydrogenase family)
MAIRAPHERHAETIAIVTGGGQGVGLAIATQLVAEGCKAVALVGRDLAKLRAAAEGLARDGVRVEAIAGDVSRVADCEAIFAKATSALGTPNVLVNAAATSARGKLVDTSEATFDAIFATNVKGPFFMSQQLAKGALEAGKPAAIVNILSMAAHGGAANLTPYAASKGALATLTRNIANAYKANRIRCNAILPGWMDTPGEDLVQKKWHGAGDDWLEKAEAAQPMGQLVKPDQLALLASYMASPDAGVMTGSLVDYDQTVVGAA